MKSLLYYLIQVITCSGILYSYYHFFLRNKKFHIYNRYYLLIATTLSILIPFLNIPVYFSASETNSSLILKTITSISSNDFTEPVSSAPASIKNNSISIEGPLFCCYVLFSVTFIVRIMFSLRRICQIKKKYTVQKLNTIYFVNTTEPGTPFSFFRWLFWNQKIELKSEKGEQVFRHELFHIEQKHSFDILYLELLTIIFWMNPFLHLIKKETKVIHEFLADRFAINQGGKWEYAELLLMQSLNTEHHLTNPFFYNQIKRRIAMITSSQKTSHKYLRKIMVLPVAAIVIALFAFSYKNKKANNSSTPFDKPVTVVIDAGHGMDPAGKHTGVSVSDGSFEDDIVLSISKKIKELNTNGRLKIVLTRENKNIVDLKKRVEFSNSQNADLLISLHTNAASNEEKDTNGMDILCSGKNRKYFPENKILAAILYNYFYQIHPVNDIKLSDQGIYIIDNSDCPSALIECGYLTDPNDLAFVKDDAGQIKIAKSILQSIEQYFLQKQMPDWEQRKRTVSDTAWPEIKFNRNSATGKMEGIYNGKKFNKMTDYKGQFAFYFDHEVIMIGKEQTEELKKKYGKDLNELFIKDPNKQKAEEKEQQELKEMLVEKQVESEKVEMELKHLAEEKQLEIEKQELELKQIVSMRQLEMEKAELELKERMDTIQRRFEGSEKEFRTKHQEDQKRLEEYLIEAQKEHKQLEKAKREFLIKQEEEQRQLEKSKKEYLTKQQKDQEYLEKTKKEFLINQQEDQKKLEKAQKELEKQQLENRQKPDTQDFPPISRAVLKSIRVTSLLELPSETKVIGFTFTMDNEKGGNDVVDTQGNTLRRKP